LIMTDRDEKLLIALFRNSESLSLTMLAHECGWGIGEGTRSKVRRGLSALRAQKLVNRSEVDWTLSKGGRAMVKRLIEK
jgi:hypothetical protein